MKSGLRRRLGTSRYVAVAAFMLVAGLALYGQAKAVGPTGPAIDVGQLTPEAWAALDPHGAVTGVTVSSKVVVKFYLTDSKGVGLRGMGNFKVKAATASLARACSSGSSSGFAAGAAASARSASE